MDKTVFFRKAPKVNACRRSISTSAWHFGHFHVNPGLLVWWDEVLLLSGDGKYSRCPKFSQHKKEFDEESRAQKPSLLLRPALLIRFEVRVTRVSVQKSA
jgi:hypothetical protein